MTRLHSSVVLAALAAWGLAAFALAQQNARYEVPYLPGASEIRWQGQVRIANNADAATTVRIAAVDDTGYRVDGLTLDLAAGSATVLSAVDLEQGNEAIGLTGSTGAGTGGWRLELESDADIEPRAYATLNGFLTALQDAALPRGDVYRVVTFNPGENPNQVSLLRLVNPGARAASITVEGTDDTGETPGSGVSLDLPAGTAVMYTSSELESGVAAGLTGALGDGAGKWRLDVSASRPVVVMSLLSTPGGHLTNLSATPAYEFEGGHLVPLFPPSSDPFGRQGFVRVVNRSAEDGDVQIAAFDESTWSYGPLTLAVEAGHTAHFNSNDLELGNAPKGLTGSTGPGEGDWSLELTSALDIEVLSYIRVLNGGYVTVMHDTAVQTADGRLRYYVPIFHPRSYAAQASLLRLANPGGTEARIVIKGLDDAGRSGPDGEVSLMLAAGDTRTLTARELEQGGERLEGNLGTGEGSWRLHVDADRELRVMSLGHSPEGPLANLSRGRLPSARNGPDLVVESFQASARTLSAGEGLTLAATVGNQGDEDSPATTLNFYRSLDSRISPSDRAVGDAGVPRLATGATSSGSVVVTAPGQEGTYYYGACVEAVAAEYDSTNNCSAEARVAVTEPDPEPEPTDPEPEPPDPPDLNVTASVNNPNPAAGAAFTLSATVRNRGGREAEPTTLRYYRSEDADITVSDMEIDSAAVGSLAVGASSDGSTTVDAPLQAGKYYYGACADAVAGESSIANNCSEAVAVDVRNPDLAVSASVSEANPAVGASFTLSATVRNDGGAAAAASTLRYFRSDDDEISIADSEIGTSAVESLEAAASSGEKSTTVNTPTNPGTFYYGACVDAVATESDTTNNCSAALEVTVRAADLVVHPVSVSDTGPDAGAPFTFFATVRNQGAGPAAMTTLRYYRSADTTISPSVDSELARDAVAGLAAGAGFSDSADLHAPADAGTYYYGACVDPVPSESDVSNNCSVAVAVTVTASLGYGAVQYRLRPGWGTNCRASFAEAWMAFDRRNLSRARTAARDVCVANGPDPTTCNDYCSHAGCFAQKSFRNCAAAVWGRRRDGTTCSVEVFTGFSKDEAESKALAWCNRQWEERCQIVASGCNTVQDP